MRNVTTIAYGIENVTSCADAGKGPRGLVRICLSGNGTGNTYMAGRITDQELFSILHSGGTSLVERTTTVKTHKIEITSESQKRLRTLGTSIQKLERSTSFLVVSQVMLHEKRWASIAWET